MLELKVHCLNCAGNGNPVGSANVAPSALLNISKRKDVPFLS